MTSPTRLDDAPMSRPQTAAVAVAILLNGLDGYDAASISFAAPGLAADWGLAPDLLGWVLSMELIGMAAGALFFGDAADRFGRRPTILACLAVMAVGMIGAALAGDVAQLSAVRVLTGLGIGGMISALTALVSEHSNGRRRALALALMVAGYSMGLVLGGIVARNLLLVADWRSVFVFGAAITVIALPLAWALVPETFAWLIGRRPANALARANEILRRFGHPALGWLPEMNAPPRRGNSFAAILRPPLVRATFLLTLAYSTHLACFYFILKWIPKLVVDLGLGAASGADVLVFTMIGGALAAPVFAMVANATSPRAATIGALACAFVAVNLFARTGADFGMLLAAGGAVGVFANSAAVGFYALLAASFPAELRATGVGFGMGVGRAGAALGPAAGGILFANGFELPAVGLIVSAGTLLSAFFILLLREKEPR
jgi:benzoate transport